MGDLLNHTAIAKHVLYPRVPDTVPQLEHDIERLTDAETAVLSYLERADAGDDDWLPWSAAQDEVWEALRDARVILTKRLVEMTATPAAPWHITNECGELIASVFTVNHQGYHQTRPDGTHTVTASLDYSDGGPWDGQFYTITRELAPAAQPRSDRMSAAAFGGAA